MFLFFKEILLLLVAMLSLSVTANQEGVMIPSPPAVAERCTTCHGADGNSLIAQWPKLAGQQVQYMVEQLKAFKKGPDGLRPSIEMRPEAEALTPTEMEEVSRYYAAQKLMPGETNPQYMVLGKRIYQGGIMEKGVPPCAACHGPSGLGNEPARWPRLAGQHAAYIKQQLMAYRSGERKTTTGMMKDVSSGLDEVEMDAVSAYIEGMSGLSK
jgi:cytochrome c553